MLEDMIKLDVGFDFQSFFINYGFKILGSILIVVFAYLLMKAIGNGIRLALYKTKVDETLTNFLVKLVKIIIIVVGILAALNNVGVDTTSFVALFTATSFAISFAFKETLSNIAAGVLVIVFRPFKLGDLVKCGAGEGFVSDISLFSVTLKTYDNTNIIVPNSKVVSDNIYNYSREENRRIDYAKTIAPSELCDLRNKVVQELSQCDLVLKQPEVYVGVKAINGDNIDVSIQIWVKNENYERALMQANEVMSKVL